ncbi:hypothetical protein AMTRI_Chr01g131880 [Amborella trichopoda]
MFMLSWNVRGLGDPKCRNDVKFLIQKFNPEVVILQETKSVAHSFASVMDMWGHGTVKFVGVDAIGASGGLWVMWDPLTLHCVDVLRTNRFLVVFFQGPNSEFSWGFVNFLSSLGDVLLSHNIHLCLGGDFNFILWLDDNSSIISLNSSMTIFNSFIECFQLFYLPITGTKFTWSNNSVTNLVMSNLDRFMAIQKWMEAFPLTYVKALLRLSSDHIPLFFNMKLICSSKKPFRMNLGWLNESEVVDLIKATWENSITFGSMDFSATQKVTPHQEKFVSVEN